VAPKSVQGLAMLTSRHPFTSGMLAIAPLALAAMPFGMIFGAEALRHGLTAGEVILMSAAVFAGGSQFMAVGLWQDPVPWIGIVFAVLLVNLRHVLMSASLVRKMERFRPWQRWLGAFLLADETWATSERRAFAQPLTPAFYAGAGLTLYLAWVLGTALGTVLGSLVRNPERLGLDFAFPAVFICLVMGFARSWRAAPVILASAAAALITRELVGGTWFVIVGGLAGMTVAAILPPAPPASR
jgi:4-azaleucine resistance transporter AzlC